MAVNAGRWILLDMAGSRGVDGRSMAREAYYAQAGMASPGTPFEIILDGALA